MYIIYVYILLIHTYKTYDYIFYKCIYIGQLGEDDREAVIILKSRKESRWGKCLFIGALQLLKRTNK